MKTLATTLFATLQILIITPLFGQHFTSHATINQDFCGKSVLVTMKKGVDGMQLFNVAHTAGRGHTTEPIAGFSIAYIRDLTYIPRSAGAPAPRLLNEETFMQIVVVRLHDYDKQHVLDIIEQLRFVDGVHYAEPNYFVRTRTTVIPNDTRFFELWGLTNTQVPQAWALTTGSHDVRVGIIDIGFGAHSDLNANFDFRYAWCFSSNQAFTQENIGTTIPPHSSGVTAGWHANHVAGTIGAVGNNSLGVTGVNWNVSLVPLDVFVRFHNFGISGGVHPVTTTERQTDAVTRAIIHDIPIINMSMGGFEDNYTFMNHIRTNFNGLFVWAAGNSRSNVDNRFAQATVPSNTLGVGALYPSNTRATFSCFGAQTVEIWAPGTDILSTVLNDSYLRTNGTSMASPHVAGVAALLLAKKPNLTGEQLKALILEGALPVTIQPPSGTSHLSKRLNALGALDLLDIVDTAQIPYTEGFETTIRAATALPHNGWTHSADIAVWRAIGSTMDGTATTHEPRTGNRQLARNYSQSGHYAWAFSQPIQLYEGVTYTVSFWYRAPGRKSTTQPYQIEYDKFKAQIGPTTHLVGRGGANVEMQGATTILSHTNRQTHDWTEATLNFTATTSGLHFIGFHDMTSANQPGQFIGIDDISITETPVTSIDIVVETRHAPSLQVFPNPVTDGYFYIEAEEMRKIEVIDMLGRIVMQKDVSSSRERVDASNLRDGLYFVRVITRTGTALVRIVKQ